MKGGVCVADAVRSLSSASELQMLGCRKTRDITDDHRFLRHTDESQMRATAKVLDTAFPCTWVFKDQGPSRRNTKEHNKKIHEESGGGICRVESSEA